MMGPMGSQASSDAVRSEIVSKFGLHPVSGNSDADRSSAELDEFADDLVRGVRMKGDLTEHFYLRSESMPTMS